MSDRGLAGDELLVQAHRIADATVSVVEGAGRLRLEKMSVLNLVCEGVGVVLQGELALDALD